MLDSLGSTDGTRRTDKATEVTAYTLGAYQPRTARIMIEDDSLMAPVVTRHFTATTTDTQFRVELRINDRVAVQMVGLQELRQLLSHQCSQFVDASLGHIALQAQDKVVDDAIAVLHHRCTDLHVATAYLNKETRLRW